MAQPRASNPVSAMRAVSVVAHEHLHAVAAHRVVALGGGVERGQPRAVPRPAAVVEDHLLVQVAQIVEHHAKNSRTRASVSASASISSCVV